MAKKRTSSVSVCVPLKKKKLSEEGGPSGASVTTLDEGEESFPRGGQETLTPLEKRVIQEKAKEDLLFSEGTEGGDVMEEGEERKSKITRKKTKSSEHEKPSSKRLDNLSLKKLTPGILLLGAVLEIHEYEVIFSLPFNMRGTVAISDVSDPITQLVESEAEREDSDREEAERGDEAPRLRQLFHVGALMPCYVMAVDGRRVSLSVNPRLINTHLLAKDICPNMVLPGWIKSIEDHGYIVDFGVEGKTAFLLRKNSSEFIKSCNRGKALCRGQVVQCLVLPGARARAVPVSINPSVVQETLLPGDSLVGVNALLPGMLVNAAVKEVAPNGLLLTLLGGLEAVVSLRHLPSSREFTTDGYNPKKKYKARVLWTNASSKTMGLTLQRQIVTGLSFEFPNMEIGDIYQAAKVVHVDRSSALYLDLGGDVTGYAPIWMVYDKRQDSFGKEHRRGSHHPCRVVQFNLIDGVAIVSLQSSVLEKRYMKYSDVNVGDVVESTVERVGDFGVILSITDSIRGLCPRMHLSDVSLKHPKKKLTVGAKVKSRVLSVQPAERKLLLSCKKSFVRSTLDPLSEYSQAKVGEIHQGVISSVRNYGCIVHFYGQVKGLVLKSELSSTQMITNPASVFWAGQPVECKVLQCDSVAEKLLLSLKLDAPVPMEVSQENALTPGMFIDAEVTGIVSNGINLKYSETGELAFLPMTHLSDHPGLCPLLLNLLHQSRLERALREDKPYVLRNALVVCGKFSFRPALLTMKRCLHEQAKECGFISHLSELKTGLILPGFIRRTMPYGCFVEFPHNLSGLAPTKYLSDELLSDASGVYQEAQSVMAKVLEVDEERGRFLLSLRPSHLRLVHRLSGEEEEVRKTLATRLQGYLEERDAVLEAMATATGGDSCSTAMAEMFHPGKCVVGHVTEVRGDEVTVDLPEGAVGRATTHTAHGVCVEVGSEVVCCMLDVNWSESSIIVSLNPKLTEGHDAIEQEGRRKSSRRGKRRKQTLLPLPSSSLAATVEHTTPHYLLCSCTTLSGTHLAYGLMDTGQLGLLPPFLKHLKPGQQVSTTVHSTSSLFRGTREGPPVVMVTSTPSTHLLKGATPTSKHTMREVKEGDIISVVVQGVKTTQMNVKYHLQRGRVHCTLAADHVTQGSTAFADISPGDVVRARVVKIREKQITGKASKLGATLDVLELTTKPSLLDSAVDLDGDVLLKKTFVSGEEITGFISEVKDKGIHVLLSPRAEGFVPQMLVSTDTEVLCNLRAHFAEGEAVGCTVISCVKASGKAHLHNVSMIGPVEQPAVGDMVVGKIRQVIPHHALMVAIPGGVGRVDITDVTDHYCDNPLETVKESDGFVKCCVVAVDEDKVDLSLRVSRTGEQVKEEADTPPDPEIASLEDLAEGDVVRGYVKAVTNVGVFVRLGRQVDGRVKITHLSDGFVKNFKKLYSIGDLVKGKVLEVDPVKGAVELSLRLSHVDPVAAKLERRRKGKRNRGRGEEEKAAATRKGGRKVTNLESTSDGDSVELSSYDPSSSSDESCMEVASEREEGEEKEEEEEEEERPSLQLTGGFQWDASVVGEGGWDREQASSGSESEGEAEEPEKDEKPSSKKSRRQKRAAKKAEEVQIYSTEQALLDVGRVPESADDFDRLLLTNPNSSALWVQYMAFYLHTAEVDRARGVAERALKTISFREEHEKLNVWVALMNLENLYGSQETLVGVFEQALQQSEPIDVFFRLVSIYERSKKMDLAEQLYQTMTKRFSTSLRVWAQYGHFLMRRGKQEAARSLLQRSLKSLSNKQQHVDIISKFAQYEFRYGEPERGRTMFESLLSSYPRRVDLWSIYVDMLTRLGDKGKVREVFERAIHLKISAKKMKFIFKRYLEFERQHGSPAGVEAVKEKAKAYVESRTMD